MNEVEFLCTAVQFKSYLLSLYGIFLVSLIGDVEINNYLGLGISISMIKLDMEDGTDIKKGDFRYCFYFFFNSAILSRYPYIKVFFSSENQFSSYEMCLLWWKKHWSISQKSNILILCKLKCGILPPWWAITFFFFLMGEIITVLSTSLVFYEGLLI